MPDDLFTLSLRERLFRRGWRCLVENGQRQWSPPGVFSHFSEDEAICQLARLEEEESRHGD